MAGLHGYIHGYWVYMHGVGWFDPICCCILEKGF
jgi:hypothetical protein